MQWFYVENGQQAGPVEDAALARLVHEGKVDAKTLVWCAEMTNWEPYGAVAARKGLGAPAASPAPAAATATDSFLTDIVGDLGSFDPSSQDSATCSECGRPFPTEEMVSYAGGHVCAECKPLFFQKLKEGVNTVGELKYAGFWIRLGAIFVDGIVLNIIQFPLRFVVNSSTISGILMLALLGQVIAICYYTYFNGKDGQTPGKKACGLRVVRPDGSPISYGRAFGRYFGYMLSSLTLSIGYIMAAFDEEKRALHDRVCDTRVIRIR